MDGAGREFKLDAVGSLGKRTRLGILILMPTVPQNTLNFRDALMEMPERLTHHAK